MSLSARTIIVTGGSKGIGLDIANYFSSLGDKVVIGSRSKPLQSCTKNLIHHYLDASVESSISDFITYASSISGSIDVLVNNAGLSRWESINNISYEFLDLIFRTNLFSCFFTTKYSIPFMSPGSSIVNISSIAGKRGSSNNSAYVASKFALNGFTQSMAKELGTFNIRVNSICPVLISTPGLLDALSDPSSPAKGDPMSFLSTFTETQSALGRLPSGLDVAKFCYFLASNDASSITGQNINLDCGVFPQ